MRKFLSVLFAVFTLAGFGEDICHIFETNSTDEVRRFHAYKAKTIALIPTPAYITNGLTHWWDGQINIKIGYHQDGVIPFWKDLVGDKDLVITSTQVSFDELSFVCPNGRYGGLAATDYQDRIPDNEIVTVEVCARPYNSSTYSPSANAYDTLVCNGTIYEENPYYSCSCLVAMFLNQRHIYNGGQYFLILARGEDEGVRSYDFSSYYDIHPQYASGYWNFFISFTNDDLSHTRFDYPYRQPYYKSSFEYIDFSGYNFASSYFLKSEEAFKNNSRGSLASSTFRPNYPGNCFTIGGTRARVYQWGSYYWVESNFWRGKIFCVRTYNRRLSMEEREFNAAIDYQRFNGVRQ